MRLVALVLRRVILVLRQVILVLRQTILVLLAARLCHSTPQLRAPPPSAPARGVVAKVSYQIRQMKLRRTSTDTLRARRQLCSICACQSEGSAPVVVVLGLARTRSTCQAHRHSTQGRLR